MQTVRIARRQATIRERYSPLPCAVASPRRTRLDRQRQHVERAPIASRIAASSVADGRPSTHGVTLSLCPARMADADAQAMELAVAEHAP